jgi:hypothetical protein
MREALTSPDVPLRVILKYRDSVIEIDRCYCPHRVRLPWEPASTNALFGCFDAARPYTRLSSALLAPPPKGGHPCHFSNYSASLTRGDYP